MVGKKVKAVAEILSSIFILFEDGTIYQFSNWWYDDDIWYKKVEDISHYPKRKLWIITEEEYDILEAKEKELSLREQEEREKKQYNRLKEKFW